MGLYCRYIFPPILDYVMQRPEVRCERAKALATARGDVLEIGFGTALNLPFYPAAVERLTLVDPADVLHRRVAGRIAGAPMPVEVFYEDGARLPLPDKRFDTVVTSWTLCTVSDVAAVLAEVRRVLNPGGCYLFVEHGRSTEPRVARRQDRWNWLQQIVACGCNLNRPIEALIAAAGFRFVSLERFALPAAPAMLAPHFRGIAGIQK